MVFIEMIKLIFNASLCLQGMIKLKVTECFNRPINSLYLYVLKMHVSCIQCHVK